jgi:hypothetical protein
MAHREEQPVSYETLAPQEATRVIQSAALLGLPDFGRGERSSLDVLTALPAGVGISAELWITAEGLVTATLVQLADAASPEATIPVLELIMPSIAPESRSIVARHSSASTPELSVLPDWLAAEKSTGLDFEKHRQSDREFRYPKPVAAWPWDIKRALATLAAGGGGHLRLTARALARDARNIRAMTKLRERLIAASYAQPRNAAFIAAELASKCVLEDTALIGFEVAIGAPEANETLRHLMAMALFGTVAGEASLQDSEHDPRLLAGSSQVPERLLPSRQEAASLLGSVAPRVQAGTRQWCIGHTPGGIPVTLSDRDRARHVYLLGGTGTGKTTLLLSTILQDIHADEAVVVLDCHGPLAQDVAKSVPHERAHDLVYADAAQIGGGFAIDLLPSSADDIAFEVAADTLVSIFKGVLYKDTPEGFGPIWESYFRNALALLVAAPEEQRTLANFVRVFSEARFRRELIAANTVQSVNDFWTSATRAGGDATLENIAPYIISKLTRLVSTRHARAMFPGAAGCIDFSSAIDTNKILVLRCPKGILGEGLAQLGVSAALMKLQAAIMARSDHAANKPVRIYIDEFQNCRGDSLQTLLAEGRKFGASMVLANQSLGQIGGIENSSVGAAALANVGNLITFRLGAPDAMRLAPWLEAPESWRELCRLPDFTMNARLLHNGRPVHFQGIRSSSPGL